MTNYILKDRKPVECDDPLEWAGKFEDIKNRVVGADHLPGNVLVSTVFLGIDHRFTGKGPPILFETMIFGGPHDGYQTRCSTWEQAEKMHKVALKLAKGEKK